MIEPSTLNVGGSAPILLPAGVAGAATVGIPTLGRTATRVAVTDPGDAVLRVEFGFLDAAGGEARAWIDAGAGLDLSAATPTVLVPTTGVSVFRLAVRTAAAATVSIWLGAAS